MNVTWEDVKTAQETIARYFFQVNQNITKKPVTMIDSDIELQNEHFRLFSFMTFYGRNETPPSCERGELYEKNT